MEMKKSGNCDVKRFTRDLKNSPSSDGSNNDEANNPDINEVTETGQKFTLKSLLEVMNFKYFIGYQPW